MEALVNVHLYRLCSFLNIVPERTTFDISFQQVSIQHLLQTICVWKILEYEKIKVKTAPCLSTSIVAIINVSQVVNTNWWKYEGKVREFL